MPTSPLYPHKRPASNSSPLIDERPFCAARYTISNASRRTVDRPVCEYLALHHTAKYSSHLVSPSASSTSILTPTIIRNMPTVRNYLWAWYAKSC